jgi:predicted kinase
MIISPELDADWDDRPATAKAWEAGFSRWYGALRSARVSQGIVLIGTPGSGKSTWAKANDQSGIVIFDGCFARPRTRQRAAHAGTRSGKPVIAVWLRTPLYVCIERVEARARKVPIDKVREIHAQLLELPPSVHDGFTRVLVVRPEVAQG